MNEPILLLINGKPITIELQLLKDQMQWLTGFLTDGPPEAEGILNLLEAIYDICCQSEEEAQCASD